MSIFREWESRLPAVSLLVRRMRTADSLTKSNAEVSQTLLDFAQTDFHRTDIDTKQLAAMVEVITAPKWWLQRGEKLSVEVLADLAREFMRCLNTLLDGGSVPMIGTGRLIVMSVNRRLGDIYLGDIRQRFLNAAIDVIAPEFHRVQRCERPGCPRLFMKRKRGRYCSKFCQQKVMSERFFKNMSEARRSEYAHGHYRKRIEKLKGEKVARHIRPRSKRNAGA
jgi:hypothetical protein